MLANTIKSLPAYDHILCNVEQEADDLKLHGHIVRSYDLGYRNIFSLPSVLIKLLKVIKHHNASIIHAHLIPAVWIARIAWKLSKPSEFYFTIHSLLSKDPFEKNRLSLLIERLTYTRSQKVIAVSHTALEDYQRFIPIKGESLVIYNFVEDSFFNQKNITNNLHELQIVSVGNLKSSKNYLYLLDSLAIAKNYHLDIFGSGPLTSVVEETIKKKNLNVNLKGKGNEMHKLLPVYDLFVSASLHEGYGIAVTEAMACGIPVLVSDIPVFREIVGDSGFYFSLTDPEDLSRKINAIQILKQNGQLTAWGRKAKERAIQIASKTVYLEKLKAAYRTGVGS